MTTSAERPRLPAPPQLHNEGDRSRATKVRHLHPLRTQGAAGAHDEDLLGTITVYGNLVKASDIKTDATSVYGAYEKVGELPAGVHYQLEDDGVLPNGATDGGHHDEAAMHVNLAMANHM